MALKRCDVCSKPFKNDYGVLIHKRRSSCKGKGAVFVPGVRQKAIAKARSDARTILGDNGETGRETIYQILADHPTGLPTKDIFAQLSAKGFRQLNANYVSQAVAGDSRLTRSGRGFYRVKKRSQTVSPTGRAGLSPLKGTTIVRNAQETLQAEHEEAHPMPREVLLLRIDTLTTQNEALRDAHISLLRGAFA